MRMSESKESGSASRKEAGRRFTVFFVKLVCCLCLLMAVFKPLADKGLKPYLHYRDDLYRNDFTGGQAWTLPQTQMASQTFTAAGDLADNFAVYLDHLPGEPIFVTLSGPWESNGAEGKEDEPDGDVDLPDKEAGPADKEAGPADKEVGPTDKDVGPADKEAGPTDKDVGPADKEAGSADKEAGSADKDALLPDEKILARGVIEAQGFTAGTWNTIPGLSARGLIKGKTYRLSFETAGELTAMVYNSGSAPAIFGDCSVDGEKTEGSLALGALFTYRYAVLGSVFEGILTWLFAGLMGAALCLSVFRIEALYRGLRSALKRRGAAGALFFSALLIRLQNPLEAVRLSMSGFDRQIGSGVLANVDVSRRISQFSRWFLFFAVFFALFYLLANGLEARAEEEGKKVSSFLNRFFILADSCLALRFFSYFSEAEQGRGVYDFSVFALGLTALAGAAYLVMGLDRSIAAAAYGRLQFAALSFAVPISVFVTPDGEEGRVFLGIWAILAFSVLLLCRLMGRWMDKVSGLASVGALFPLVTSFYIEGIHILNQRGVYVAYPAVHYRWAVVLFGLLPAAVLAAGGRARRREGAALGSKENRRGRTTVSQAGSGTLAHAGKRGFWGMPSFAVPAFVLGVAFLSVQLPLSVSYYPDLYEHANYSILISDFLNFGKIPLVEHYGGQMLTYVFEGILYGLFNRDMAGAALSPYAVLLVPFLSLLFYFLLREAFDEEIAPFAALLFPFYAFWSYFGLGMLLCLGVMAYVKKNTWVRAALLWGAFIFCALYRLDLGFAFGAAAVAALAVYVIVHKNGQALRQLLITLGAWAVFGVSLWIVLCLAKEIDPVGRLAEFLLVSLSNRNWAYSSIGAAGRAAFAWCYILVPFMAALGLLTAIVSRDMRERLGVRRWVLLLMMGMAFFANFSRGLVRHSLVENVTGIVIFSGYVFLAMFFSAFAGRRELFIPLFMGFMIANSLFLKEDVSRMPSLADNAATVPAPVIESWSPGRFAQEEFDKAAAVGKDWRLPADDLPERRTEEAARLLPLGALSPEPSEAGAPDGEADIADEARTSEGPVTLWEQLAAEKKTVQRVRLAKDFQEYTGKYTCLLDAFLGEGETFADFSNRTILYSLMGREDPFYVSQAPLQLSGEFTQEAFARQMAGVGLVLMPLDAGNYRESASLDGINNFYRYYKASEYIYQNYVPFCRYGSDYALWCLKEKEEEYEALWEELPEEERDKRDIARIGYGYDGPKRQADDTGNVSYAYTGALHTYNLDQLPRIWAEEDEKNAADNPSAAAVQRLGDGQDIFIIEDGEAIDRSKGNYLRITASYDGNDRNGRYEDDDEQTAATVLLGCYEDGRFDEACRFTLSLKEGTHTYLIRCSADYYWYTGDINAVRMMAGEPAYHVEMAVLEGD